MKMGTWLAGGPRLDARDRGRRRGPDRRDRVLAVHLRPARAGDRRAHQALRGGEPGHQGQAHPRAVRRLPAEDRRRDPRRPGARRGPALLRLAPGLPEGEAPPALADRAVRRRRDRARLLPAGEADEGGRAVLRRAHRRALALPVLEQEAVHGGRPRPREAAPDARRAARHGPEADQARRRRQPPPGRHRARHGAPGPSLAARGADPPDGRPAVLGRRPERRLQHAGRPPGRRLVHRPRHQAQGRGVRLPHRRGHGVQGRQGRPHDRRLVPARRLRRPGGPRLRGRRAADPPGQALQLRVLLGQRHHAEGDRRQAGRGREIPQVHHHAGGDGALAREGGRASGAEGGGRARRRSGATRSTAPSSAASATPRRRSSSTRPPSASSSWTWSTASSSRASRCRSRSRRRRPRSRSCWTRSSSRACRGARGAARAPALTRLAMLDRLSLRARRTLSAWTFLALPIAFYGAHPLLPDRRRAADVPDRLEHRRPAPVRRPRQLPAPGRRTRSSGRSWGTPSST